MSLLASQRARRPAEILDASVQLYRMHAASFILIAAIITLPPAVIGVFVPDAIRGVLTLIGNLLLPLGAAATSLFIAAVMTEGEISVGESFRRIPRMGSVIGSQIVYGLAVALSTLFFVIPGLIVAIRLALVTPVLVIEETGIDPALKRSWALTKGHWWHTFKTIIAGYGVGFVLFMGLAFLVGLLAGALNLPTPVVDLLTSAMFALFAPLFWIVSTLLYIDLRVRVEGADVEAMVADLGSAASEAPA